MRPRNSVPPPLISNQHQQFFGGRSVASNNTNNNNNIGNNNSSFGNNSNNSSKRMNASETSFSATDRLIKLEIECQTLREENEVLKFHLSSLLMENGNRSSSSGDENLNHHESISTRQEMFSALAEKNQQLEEQNRAMIQQLALIETEAKATSQSFKDLMREHEALVDAIDGNHLGNITHQQQSFAAASNSNRAIAAELEQEQLQRAKLHQQLQLAASEADRHRAAWEHSRRTAEERGTKVREVEKRLQEASAHIQQLQTELREHVCQPPPPDPRAEELRQRRAALDAEERQQERTRWERRIQSDYVPVEAYAELEAVCRSLRDHITRTAAEVDCAKEENGQIKEERSQIRREHEHAASRVSVLTADNAVLREQTVGLRERLRQTQDDFDVFRSHMGRVTQQRDTQAKEIQQLRNEIFQLRKVSSANQALVTAAWRALPPSAANNNNNNNNNNPNTNASGVTTQTNKSQQQPGLDQIQQFPSTTTATSSTANEVAPHQADAMSATATNNNNVAVVVGSEGAAGNNIAVAPVANTTNASSRPQQEATVAVRRAPSVSSVTSSSTAQKNAASASSTKPSSKAEQMAKMLLSAALGGGSTNNNYHGMNTSTTSTTIRPRSATTTTNVLSGSTPNNKQQQRRNDEFTASLAVSPQTPRPSSSAKPEMKF